MDNPNFLLIIEAINNEENINNFRLYRHQLRDESDPLSLPEVTFRSIYRLSRQLAHHLIVTIGPHLPENEGSLFIPKQIKVLVALHFFAQGNYQKAVVQDFFIAMSQSSVSRCISDINTALEQFYHLIKFPTTNAECEEEKQRFMQMENGFPGIIGAIDCTHIAISSPPANDINHPAIVFLNRKGYYSLNVQIICNANLKILAVNARYPGSVHDSAIWMTSVIRREVENMHLNGNTNCWLIGDSGYPLEPWLMTPINSPHLTMPEARYNRAHKSVRNVIERLNGVLKGRFRCLLKDRVLHYSPPVASRIINSCAVLHNMCLDARDLNEEYYNDDVGDFEVPEEHNYPINNLQRGRLVRERLLQLHFN